MRMMFEYEIIRLIDRPEYKQQMAQWFHERWYVPTEAYLASMDECLSGKTTVPQWYAAISGGKIIGGMGVIENDFHDRKDLTPNVCAVYVEPDFRCRGIAGNLLTFVCEDMNKRGVKTLYLITEHDSLYERYGWRFFCTAMGDGAKTPSRIYIHEMI